MGSPYESGSSQGMASFLALLSGATSKKYERIKIIATTNNIKWLPSALLRQGRIGAKLLVNYPNKKELHDIVNKVLKKFYADNIEKDEANEAFGNLGKDAFANKFTK